MFGNMPQELFRMHNWRTDVETLGELPAEFIREQSEGKLNYTWPAQVNKLISQGGSDLILSIGQVVPHEVIGMANHSKNILIGSGGREGINRSHYLGAVYGMERIMGRAENPVRNVLNRACEKFLRHLPIVYVQTVVGRGETGGLWKLMRDVLSIGRSMVRENPWTAPVAMLGVAVPAVILGNYLLESVFARWWMARYLRLRALRGAGCGVTPIAEVAA